MNWSLQDSSSLSKNKIEFSRYRVSKNVPGAQLPDTLVVPERQYDPEGQPKQLELAESPVKLL